MMANIVKPSVKEITYLEIPARNYGKNDVVCLGKNEAADVLQDGRYLDRIMKDTKLSKVKGIKAGLFASEIKNVTIRYFTSNERITFNANHHTVKLKNGTQGMYCGYFSFSVFGLNGAKFDAFMRKSNLKPEPDGSLLYHRTLEKLVAQQLDGVLEVVMPNLPFVKGNRWNFAGDAKRSPQEKEFFKKFEAQLDTFFAQFGIILFQFSVSNPLMPC